MFLIKVKPVDFLEIYHLHYIPIMFIKVPNKKKKKNGKIKTLIYLCA